MCQGLSCFWRCQPVELPVDVAHSAAESAGHLGDLWILGLAPWLLDALTCASGVWSV